MATPGEAAIPVHMISGGTLRSLPNMEIGTTRGLDGFFAARLIRRV